MATELLPDDLWQEIRLHLPRHPKQPKGGHPYANDRMCLRGIIFVLRAGLSWQSLPTEAFGVSGSTCWRRFRQWSEAGVWLEIHERLVRSLGQLGKVNLNHAVADAQAVRAVFGGHTRDRTRSIAGKTAVNATC
jgi:transposase